MKTLLISVDTLIVIENSIPEGVGNILISNYFLLYNSHKKLID